jgi:cytochrome c peroxidase
MRAFVATGCAGCHNGANFGGTTLQKFGVVKDYWLETGSDKGDHGRFAVTKKQKPQK